MQNKNLNYTADENNSSANFVPRWHQPIAVWLLMIVLVATAAYSLLFAPACIEAAALNQLADDEYKKEDFTGAEINYRAALKLKPEANYVRVGLALSLFKRHRLAADLEALTLLGSSTLTPSEKVRVINAMPEQFRNQFSQEHL